VDLLPQADGVELEQRLYMLPAAECSHAAYAIDLAYVVEARTTRITVNCTLHVCGLELAALHDDGTGGGDGALRDVERVVVVLREAKDDCDVCFASGGADLRHLWGVVGERVLNVFDC
jgi:hypothetical protein